MESFDETPTSWAQVYNNTIYVGKNALRYFFRKLREAGNLSHLPTCVYSWQGLHHPVRELPIVLGVNSPGGLFNKIWDSYLWSVCPNKSTLLALTWILTRVGEREELALHPIYTNVKGLQFCYFPFLLMWFIGKKVCLFILAKLEVE